ncbi:helix-turn-helix transcriptional regulator [Parendozoicomonas haliclonae]|uniref:Bacterial regulatory protein, luxR family n=1 Tax=Parendozoicomonas haliclonae TaxID=1960125 RepID=A0A1X7AJU7_9GAMM|nr:LuxR family transcriptional regulator [Parendozoicomonas haliclonae]SMA47243.1 Bacterial regulatory protein, luxR family [Parendozoicomonas haliclonae]
MQPSQVNGRVVLSSQLAKENLGQTQTDIYTQTARPLDVIQQEIQNFISTLGFTSFRYSSVPTSLADTKTSSFELDHRADGREGFGSLPDKLYNIYYKNIARHDNLLQSVIASNGPVFHEPASDIARTFYRDNNINSHLCLPMRWQTGHDWFCLFTFQSPLSTEELRSHYQTIQDSLNSRALGWHLELMAFRQHKFNPYIVRKILTPRTRHILKLAADGFSSRHIADMTGISDNGVNYHYREAKRILGARNRAHLVALAKDQKLI